MMLGPLLLWGLLATANRPAAAQAQDPLLTDSHYSHAHHTYKTKKTGFQGNNAQYLDADSSGVGRGGPALPAPHTLKPPRPTRCCVIGRGVSDYAWDDNNAAPGQLSVSVLEKSHTHHRAWIVDLQLRIVDSKAYYPDHYPLLLAGSALESGSSSRLVLAPVTRCDILVDGHEYAICDENGPRHCDPSADWFNAAFHLKDIPAFPLDRAGKRMTTPYMGVRYHWREINGNKYNTTVYSSSCYPPSSTLAQAGPNAPFDYGARSPGYCWSMEEYEHMRRLHNKTEYLGNRVDSRRTGDGDGNDHAHEPWSTLGSAAVWCLAVALVSLGAMLAPTVSLAAVMSLPDHRQFT